MINWLKNLKRWIAQILNWLLEVEKVWFYCLFIAAVFLLGNILPVIFSTTPVSLISRIHLIGILFQLLGILTVSWGLYETRKIFGRPSLIDQACKWINRFPKFHPGPVFLSFSDTFSLRDSATLSISEQKPPGKTQSVEERISWLESEYIRTQTRFQGIEEKLTDHTQSLMTATETLAKKIMEGDRQNLKKLEEVSVGGIHLEMFGVICLFLGAILSF